MKANRPILCSLCFGTPPGLLGVDLLLCAAGSGGDFDLPGLCLLRHRDAQRQDATVVGSFDIVRVQRLTQGQLPAKDTAGPFCSKVRDPSAAASFRSARMLSTFCSTSTSIDSVSTLGRSTATTNSLLAPGIQSHRGRAEHLLRQSVELAERIAHQHDIPPGFV